MTAYDVKIEQTAEFRTAVVKARTTMREFPSLWPALLDEVWPFIRATPGLWTDGHNVSLYRSEPPGVELAVEIGVQVTASFAPAGRVVPSMLPASEAAQRSTPDRRPASVRHTRPFGNGALRTAAPSAVSGGRSTETPDPQTGNFDVAVYWQLA